ncbi:MAG: methyltransferase domain-containing protein [Acidobacteria bacterium]|nr:methyltransferase domain-containing protein [Acidobacteriota bacterium]MBI3425374.1 methyltransferase domain-containing protein [Acidobacteriota bacterium]
MSEPISNDYSSVMKRDWNARARENAKWYINTVRVEQDEAEFDETGRAEVDKLLRAELGFLTQGRAPSKLRVLEIGCGIGRMTKHLAGLFGKVHAVDVSGEMIRQARERLRAFPNVHCHETSGCDFAALPSDYFDLVFSAYVFQHVPSAAVIRANLVDAFRVLKPGGICKFGVNSTADAAFLEQAHDTWTGAALPESALRQTARELGAQLLRLFDAGTQYCWVTWRKRPDGQSDRHVSLRIVEAGRHDNRALKQVPISGDHACLSLVLEGLESTADANSVVVELGEHTLLPCYVGPVDGDWSASFWQVEAWLPAGLAVGCVEVRARQAGDKPSAPGLLSLCEPEPLRPVIVTVRNASDYGTDVHTRGAKAWVMLYVKYLPAGASVENVRLQIGEQVIEPSYVGADARFGGHQVNLLIPPETPVGRTELRLLFGDAVSPGVPLQLEAPDNLGAQASLPAAGRQTK